jgi:hypothetical protein
MLLIKTENEVFLFFSGLMPVLFPIISISSHFTLYRKPKRNISCFPIEALPDIVKVLWRENLAQVAETQEHVRRLFDRIYTEDTR